MRAAEGKAAVLTGAVMARPVASRTAPMQPDFVRGGVKLCVATVAAIITAGAAAQDLEPRAYSNAPIGLNFLIGGYSYTSGGVAIDPSLPLKDAHVEVNAMTIAYARSFEMLGQSGKFDVVVPYAWLSGDAEFLGQLMHRAVSGGADPRFRLSLNFYGAPALSMKDYAQYRQDLIIGASVYVWAPWGQYDSSKLVNLGTNRWAFKAELGMSKAIGNWTIELIPGIATFTDNDNFLDGHSRAQDPVYSAQVHVIYGFQSGVWVALDGTYFTGGRTTVDGVTNADRQSNSRVGLTVAIPVDRSNSIKGYASSGVSTRTGSSFDTIGIARQYRWY